MQTLKIKAGSPGLAGMAAFLPGDPEFKFWFLSAILKRIKPTTTVLTYFGALMAVDLRDYIMLRLFWFGRWEPDVSDLIENFLKPGDVFVDVGANVGYYSLLASSIVGNSGGVVAIEASPPIFRTLEANIALNQAENIRCLNVAASDAPGELTVYSGTKGNSGMTTTVPVEGREIVGRVKASQIDAVLTADELRRVKLIKIDVEGGELAILRRLLYTIDDFPVDMGIVVEMTPVFGGDALVDIFRRLCESGFKAYRVHNDYRWRSYQTWKAPTPLVPITTLDETVSDILLTRQARPAGGFGMQ